MRVAKYVRDGIWAARLESATDISARMQTAIGDARSRIMYPGGLNE